MTEDEYINVGNLKALRNARNLLSHQFVRNPDEVDIKENYDDIMEKIYELESRLEEKINIEKDKGKETFNLNCIGKVELTKKGKCKYMQHSGIPYDKIPDKFESSLWVLMKVFGKYMSMGANPLFKNNEIKLENSL